MSDFLIRGIPNSTYKQIKKMAAQENLSVNQMVLNLIGRFFDRMDQELRKAENEAYRDYLRRS